jgi:cytochrome c553
MSSRLFVTVFATVGIFCTGAANGADVQALVQACAACHGESGLPADPKTTPIIWGQQASYLYKQLHNYKSGERKNSVMGPVVADISLADLRQIANYFAAKTWPAPQASGAGASPANGIAQCQPCHQPKFEGGPPAPRLAGLSYDYLAAAMKSFANGTRTNNGDMPQFMESLSDSERDAMARYLAGL